MRNEVTFSCPQGFVYIFTLVAFAGGCLYSRHWVTLKGFPHSHENVPQGDHEIEVHRTLLLHLKDTQPAVPLNPPPTLKGVAKVWSLAWGRRAGDSSASGPQWARLDCLPCTLPRLPASLLTGADRGAIPGKLLCGWCSSSLQPPGGRKKENHCQQQEFNGSTVPIKRGATQPEEAWGLWRSCLPQGLWLSPPKTSNSSLSKD